MSLSFELLPPRNYFALSTRKKGVEMSTSPKKPKTSFRLMATDSFT